MLIAKLKRRPFLALLTLASAMTLAAPGLALAQAKPKVAAIYTVPFEQQWVSRIHKALKAAEARGEIEYKATENVSNADYERVMREYATAGNQLIVGEAFAVEAAARKVAKDFPKVSFLMGSSGKVQAPNFSVFDNYIQEPAYLSGMVAGGMTKSNKIGLVGGFPIPEVNRLMNAFMAGAKEVNPKVEFSVSFINSWFDQGSRFRNDRQGRRRDVCGAFRCQRCSKRKGQARRWQRHQYARQIPRHGGGVRTVAYGAHHRSRAEAGERRQVHG